MKQRFIYLSFVLLTIILVSCDSKIDNSIAFQNLASNDVYVNFRGQRVDVPNGATVKLTEIDRGVYEYETIYEIPAGATSGTSEGDMAGTFNIKAGTKILIVYTSTFIDNNYTIFASATTSDDQSITEIVNPIGP
jgi:hypothetical protein